MLYQPPLVQSRYVKTRWRMTQQVTHSAKHCVCPASMFSSLIRRIDGTGTWNISTNKVSLTPVVLVLRTLCIIRGASLLVLLRLILNLWVIALFPILIPSSSAHFSWRGMLGWEARRSSLCRNRCRFHRKKLSQRRRSSSKIQTCSNYQLLHPLFKVRRPHLHHGDNERRSGRLVPTDIA